MFLKTLWGRRRNSGIKAETGSGVNADTAGESGGNSDGRVGKPRGKQGADEGGGPGKKHGAGQTGNPDDRESVGQNKGQDGDRKGMNDLDQAVDNFIEAILASEVYRAYRAELEKVKQDPELKGQIDEFRKRNFQLQSSQDADYEKLDRFEKEYESFREEPLVADFLAGELDLCRKLQEISLRVVEALNFE